MFDKIIPRKHPVGDSNILGFLQKPTVLLLYTLTLLSFTFSYPNLTSPLSKLTDLDF